MLSDRSVRKTFRITRNYWVECNICPKISKGWDYRANALTVGFGHAYNAHGLDSPRSSWAVTTTFGAQA